MPNDFSSSPESTINGNIENVSQQPKKKLHGRQFYESIGSPKYVVAPMVDRSEFAWRILTRSFLDPKKSSSVLAYSPMFHARLFNESANYRSQHFEPTRQVNSGGSPSETIEKPYLDGNPEYDRPLIVQFCANDPEELLNAARQVEAHCDAVDLNLGCPQGIAKKGHYGAFLQEDPDLIYKLINKLHTELSIPVTAKFRILESKEKTLTYAKTILSAGASIISVHGRRREQKGHNTGVADWEYIRYLRDNLPAETVIFANGNILNHEDLSACLEKTGADGVMSAEGNLSDPTIFSTPPSLGSEGRIYWRGRDGKGGYRLDYILRQYLDLMYKYVLGQEPPPREPLYHPGDTTYDPDGQDKEVEKDESDQPPRKKQKFQKKREKRPVSPNLTVMQGHMFQLLRHLITHRTDIRDALARATVGNMEQFERVSKLVAQAVRQGMQEYESNPNWQDIRQPLKPDVVRSDQSKATMEKYQRPWWVCQPFIRPLPEEALQIGSLQLKKKDRLAEENGAAGEAISTVGRDTKPDKAKVGIIDDNGIAITPDPLVSG